MALLTRVTAAAIGCALLGSCESSRSLGHADVWLSECDDGASCGVDQAGEHFAVEAFIDPSVSRYAPHGLYAYLELPRSDGTRGVLELDVPTDSASDSGPSDYQASYRELANEHLRFESRAVRGQIVVPRSLTSDDAASCGCEEGLFALQFSDADGRTRALSLGHLSRSERLCLGGLESSDEDGLHVRVESCDPPPEPSAPSVPASPPARSVPSASSPHYHDAHDTEVDSYTTVDTGCGGSSYDDGSSGGCGSSYDEGSSDGCGTSSSSENSSGCSDDRDTDEENEHSNSHSGCEGDTSNQPSSCEVAPGHRRGGGPFMGTGLPVLLVCVWQVVKARLARRRRI